MAFVVYTQLPLYYNYSKSGTPSARTAREYLVTVPALSGCYTEGGTVEEARQMTVDAFGPTVLACSNTAPRSRLNRRRGSSLEG